MKGCRPALTTLSLALASAGVAQTPDAPEGPRTLAVGAAASSIRVDGRLDEDAWARAAVIPLAYEWDPGDNVAPPVRTECLLTFDTERLYVAFRAEDPAPSAIRAHHADRDTAFLDDTVGFMIDPFNDERRAFQFRVNPLGVQMDATNSDVDGSEDWSWDAIWESRGRITDGGFVVEVAIPFSSLRFPRTDGPQTWGFVATRDFPRSTRHRIRSARTDRDRDCLVCQFDKVAGLAGMRPGLNLELDPTLTALRTDRREPFPAGPLRTGDEDVEPGLTARWGVRPNMALSVAVNPDFSQVEADVAQLDINTRFALFFPEKRPLFLEGADFFGTPIDAVFTRTVADPSWGVKLTGKEGRSAVGALVVRDRITNLLFPAYQGSSVDSLDEGSWNGVLRYRRDVGRGSSLGALYTAREGDAYHNRVVGADGLVRFGRADNVRFQYLHSWTDYPEAVATGNAQKADRFGGEAYFLRYSHATRHWAWQGDVEGYTPGFRADGGFVPRVDARTYSGGVNRTVRGSPRRWFNRIEVGAFLDYTEDDRGGRSERGMDFPVTYFGPLQTIATYNPAPNREYFGGRTYDNFRHNFSAEMRPSGSVALFLSGTVGGTIDFANSREADFVRLSPRVDVSLGRSLTASLSHTYQTLDVAPGRLFTARLTQARLVYHLGLRTFARVILQYTDIARDTALYRSPVEPRTERLFSQLLFSYKLNPQTVVLVGYSDNQLGERGADLTRTDRTFFLKVGYAWVM